MGRDTPKQRCRSLPEKVPVVLGHSKVELSEPTCILLPSILPSTPTIFRDLSCPMSVATLGEMGTFKRYLFLETLVL